jgi:hypothetical protein
MDYEKEIQLLKEKNQRLEEENVKLREHLKKYTAPSRCKTYYEKHREQILESKKDPAVKERRKESNHKAYLKRKEKLLQPTENIQM